MASDELHGKIEFLEYHFPGLAGGDYIIEVEQNVRVKNDNYKLFNTSLSVTVASDRILLKPTDIQSVFPPEGGLLDHSNILPHIALNRSTLPWERRACADDREIPWLALLLFEEGEITQSTKKLKDIPGFTIGHGENEDDLATIINLTDDLIQSLPTGRDLKLLSHVRRGTGGTDAEDEEIAVIICNRVPEKGAKSIIHLVNVEGRYKKIADDKFVFDDTAKDVPLISLKSWNFFCRRTYLITTDTLKGFTTDPENDLTLLKSLQDIEISGQDAFLNAVKEKLGKEVPGNYRDKLLTAAEWKKTFGEILQQLDCGNLQIPHGATAKAYLDAGFVPLPHHFRDGQDLVSWYHGPLLPATNISPGWSGPERTADALLRYYPSIGMLDVSYAAAWELGRILALSSKSFSVGLYNWKRSNIQQMLKDSDKDVPAHPAGLADEDVQGSPEPPAAVTDWFQEARLLNYIPPNYIIPDESLLPVESIRFFQIDPLWMDSLFDGAFSIGRVISQDLEMEQKQENVFARYSSAGQNVSGVLIRSEVVAGWPGLFIDAFSDDNFSNSIVALRRQQLSKNVMLCLFDKEIKSVEVYLKPETMHFGLSETEDKYFKNLRNADGSASDKVVDTLQWRNKDKRILNIEALAAAIKDKQAIPNELNGAEFALEMIEGAPKVRFKVN